MYRNSATRLSAFLVSVGACFFLAGASLLASENAAPSKILAPTLGHAVRHGISKPMRDFKFIGPLNPGPGREVKNESVPKIPRSGPQPKDPAVQRHFGTSQPGELGQFEGGNDAVNDGIDGRVEPPDTNGDVSPVHYIQYLNLYWVVFDKLGNTVLGPLPGNSFWQGFGGSCETSNWGDPIVKYDRLADRWLFSQFSLFTGDPASDTHQCFAVSVTNDPTGSYYLYDFPSSLSTDPSGVADYPKISIWPDGYYMTTNIFGTSFYGGVQAFERDQMLAGNSAQTVLFGILNEGGMLPTDLDGTALPPAGSPNAIWEWWDQTVGSFHWFKFHVDWADTSNSTLVQQPDIIVDPWGWPLCGASRGACIPQKGTSQLLEDLSDRMMYRAAYRNFGDHESVVLNNTVDAGGGQGAPRWYEFRDPNGSLTVYQQGTFAPDATSRWMGSIAMDMDGNIALGYSTSSATQYPAIAITGRLAGDPLGTMGAEDVFFSGTGSQQGHGRWGDYSSISVDPTDDCTFWYTQQYYATPAADFDWHTRVGSFKFPSCGGPAGTISGTVTGGGSPVAGATVAASPSPAKPAVQTFTTTTDGSGHYQLLIPVGTYDMTVTKYGYDSASANGVPVTDGGTTQQDFDLVPSLSVQVNGVVRDGSGQGWPLLARVDILPGPGGFGGASVYTDPVTGYYSTSLVAGFTYDFVVTSVGPGYVPGGGPVNIPVPVGSGPGAVVVNWNLLVGGACNAPGYVPGGFQPPVLSEGFDSGVLPAGWAINTGSGPGWLIWSGADPCGLFAGNQTGGSGPYALLNSNNNTGDCGIPDSNDDSSLRTPTINLSTNSNAVLSWANDFHDFGGATAQVDVSSDGGTTWTNVWSRGGGTDQEGPGTQTADMSFAAGHANAQVRFHYSGFWSYWWQVDNVTVAQAICTPIAGGIVVGTVSDSNTGLGINGADVANQPQPGSPTTKTSTVPGQGAGYYTMFSGSGSQGFEASKTGYAPLLKNLTVVPNGVSRQDFSLLAGKLAASPRPMTSVLPPGGNEDQTLHLINTGTGSAGWEIVELNIAPKFSVTKGFASWMDRKRVFSRIPVADRLTADRAKSAVGLPAYPNAPKPPKAKFPWAGGNVIASYSTNIPFAWGVAYDAAANATWLSNLYFYGPENAAYQYLADGTKTGATIDITPENPDWWTADGAFNSNTGMMWYLDARNNGCIFELDPANKVATGNKICFNNSGTFERGLAYDASTDTYYAGGWSDMTITHFDSSGTVLDSKVVGLGISGLAFYPDTGHLFVQVSDFVDNSIWILDAYNDYAVVNSFQVSDGAFDDHGGAGMEADCDGNLWMVNQAQNKLYEVESGEQGSCGSDIPWISVDPTSGTIAGTGSRPTGTGSSTVTFDSTGLLPGLRQAQLKIKTDTPYKVENVPVNLTVLFDDVAQGSFAWNYIYGAAGAGIMRGCSFFSFCPDTLVTRAAMAGYIERAIHGPLVSPPVYLGGFQDVFFNDFNANYIQGLVNDGITAGCSVNPPLYCPDAAIPREQMAVFILLAEHGSSYVPPDCTTAIFDDVPCSSNFAIWVNQLYAEGITAGCSTTPALFCPNHDPANTDPNNGWVTSAQMAVYLSVAFNLPHVP